MYLTTQRAREKVCPVFRLGFMTAPVDINFSTQQYCEAEGCMMWRWDTSTENENLEAFRGYCGLAGKPGGGDNAGNKN